MKKAVQLTILSILLFSIPIHTYADKSRTFTVDGEKITIHHEGDRYWVNFENGTVTWTYSGSDNVNSIKRSTSGELDERQIDDAKEALESYRTVEEALGGGGEDRDDSIGFEQVFGSLFLIGVGLLGVFAPYAAWWLEIGWKLDESEPSELAIIVNRIGGMIMTIVGLFVLII